MRMDILYISQFLPIQQVFGLAGQLGRVPELSKEESNSTELKDAKSCNRLTIYLFTDSV